MGIAQKLTTDSQDERAMSPNEFLESGLIALEQEALEQLTVGKVGIVSIQTVQPSPKGSAKVQRSHGVSRRIRGALFAE
jgi:hypothetical protein